MWLDMDPEWGTELKPCRIISQQTGGGGAFQPAYWSRGLLRTRKLFVMRLRTHHESPVIVDASGPWGSAAPAPFLRPVLSSPYSVPGWYSVLVWRDFESYRVCRIEFRLDLLMWYT